MLAKQAKEIVKCAESFPYFCEHYCKHVAPLKGLIPFKLEPWQARLADALEENRFVICTKWRMAGISTTTLIYCLWQCLFKENQSVLWLCKSKREAEGFSDMVSLIVEFFPVWMKPRMERDNKNEKHFAATDSKMYFYNPSAGRGRACTHLVIDEAAFIPDMEYHWKCLWPCLSTGGKCYMQSTVNRGGYWFNEMYIGALQNTNAFYVFKSHYLEHKDFQDESYAKAMRETLGEVAWSIEIEQEWYRGLKGGVIDAPSDPTAVDEKTT